MLSPEQALVILMRLKRAAPPLTADRLTAVSELLVQLAAAERATAATVEIEATPVSEPNGPASSEVLHNLDEALRRPLAHLRDQLSFLHSGKLGTLTNEQHDVVRDMRSNTETALAMLNGVRQMSAMLEGKVTLRDETFSPADLLRGVQDKFLSSARQREHQITVRAPAIHMTTRGDHARIRHAVGDLVDNAIRYTPPGGIIKLSAEPMGELMLFTVEDNGIGFDNEDAVHIGEPFWRALDQPLVRQHPGTGLHVYLAREMLRLHYSDLIFSGEVGVGASFSFTLPNTRM